MGKRLLFHLDRKANSLESDSTLVSPDVFTCYKTACAVQETLQSLLKSAFPLTFGEPEILSLLKQGRESKRSHPFHEAVGLSHSHTGVIGTGQGKGPRASALATTAAASHTYTLQRPWQVLCPVAYYLRFPAPLQNS